MLLLEKLDDSAHLAVQMANLRFDLSDSLAHVLKNLGLVTPPFHLIEHTVDPSLQILETTDYVRVALRILQKQSSNAVLTRRKRSSSCLQSYSNIAYLLNHVSDIVRLSALLKLALRNEHLHSENNNNHCSLILCDLVAMKRRFLKLKVTRFCLSIRVRFRDCQLPRLLQFLLFVLRSNIILTGLFCAVATRVVLDLHCCICTALSFRLN